MTATVPTADQVQALHQFVQDRNEDEWQNALTADDLSDAHVEALRRVSNTAKLSLTGTTAYLLALLAQVARGGTEGQREQAARLWDTLTSCGEEWQEHPDWRTEWANPARAALR